MANANDNPPPTAEPPQDQLAERRRQRNVLQSRRPSRRPRRSESDGRTDAVRFDGATGLLGAGLGLDEVEDADDVLDSLSDSYTRADSARPDHHEPQSTATATETPDQTAVLAADDAIRERLHHHHEQNAARTNRRSAPRGSAELPAEEGSGRPTARIPPRTPGRREKPAGAQRRRSRRLRSLIAGAAIVLAVIATLLTLRNLSTHSQPIQTAATRSTAASEAPPARLYMHRVNDAATRNPNLLTGGQPHATARHVKTRPKRARHGRDRHHAREPTHADRHPTPAQTAPATPAPQSVISTHGTPAETTPPATTTTSAYSTPATTPAPANTPAATAVGSTSSSSDTSSSHSSSGGSTTTAGPTGIGSATGCDPQCR